MSEKEPIGHWFLRVFPKIFIVALVPLYGGYQRAALINLAAYVLLMGAVSLYYFGQPGPRQLWQQHGLRGLIMDWLLMALAILPGAGIAFGVGYLFSFVISN